MILPSSLFRLGLAIMLVLLMAQGAMAQEPKSLKLGDLVSHLLVNHERIQAAQANVQSTAHLVDKAEAAWLPVVDVVVEGGHESIDKSMAHNKASWKFRNQQDLTVTQKVFDFGATDGNIETFEAMGLEAQSRLEQISQDLMTQGVRSYLSVIRGREMVQYALRSEKNIKRLSGMQEALVERGAGLSYEELQVKGQLAGAQALLVNMERSFNTALNSFRAVYGFTPTKEQVDSLKIPNIPLDSIPGTLEECIAISTAENPYLTELTHSVVRNEGMVHAVDANFYPEIDLVGEYSRKEQDQAAQGVRYETKGTLQFSYNIFNGGGDSDAAKSARADLLSARKSVLDRQRSVEEKVRNAWLDLTMLKKNVELYENQANIIWEFLSLVKKKKAMGAEVGLLDILVGERDYINAISSKVGAEIDYNIAAYVLLFQMGRMDLSVLGS